ncbi:helix-turn-helix transcriptional regulator [Duganella hordei]|uniref:helix-turn-helix transcriptional regulator n=1 Tax=Duganella hordei TaxID=2865934 RepID=UPI0030EA1252
MQPDELIQIQSQLRYRLLEDSRTRVSGGARDLAAHLLLYLDDGLYCWNLTVSWLRDLLDADRVDGGFFTQGDQAFIPLAESLHPTREVPSSVGLKVDTGDFGVRCVRSSNVTVSFADVESENRVQFALRQHLRALGTRSRLAVALRDGEESVGLICADWMEADKATEPGRRERLDEIARSVLGPVFAALRRASKISPPVGGVKTAVLDVGPGLALLTPAERKVAQLAVEGLSYKEIARKLNRSTFTVDHQLRSIREKLGVCSTSKAIHILTEELVA